MTNRDADNPVCGSSERRAGIRGLGQIAIRPLTDCRLYTFVDSAYLHGREPLEIARELCAGGSDILQLRAKDWPAERIREIASGLAAVCRDAGVHLVINDHPAIAEAVGAPLAHLGQEDFFDAGHRNVSDILGGNGNLGLGLSSHAPEQALRAVEAGAAYVAVGPVFATPTKPGRPPVTLDYVRWAKENLDPVPWFAIGGIHLGNLEQVLDAGATRICVVSAILNAPNITEACREFRRRLE